MDIDSIPYGVDFEQHIRDEVASCDVVLVLIGDEWLDVVDETGTRRIDQPDDFVRLEIESGLSHEDVRVVPVLVEGARMPPLQDLPQPMQRLARLNAIKLSDLRWKWDLKRLAGVVERLGVSPLRRTVSLSDLSGPALEAAVHQAPARFRTLDISAAASVVSAHGDVAPQRTLLRSSAVI